MYFYENSMKSLSIVLEVLKKSQVLLLAVLFETQYEKHDRRFSKYLGLYIRFYCCKYECLSQI